MHRVDRRVRAQAAHTVPVGGPARSREHRPPGCTPCATSNRNDRNYGKAIGFRYHDGRPGIVEGLLSRGDRPVGRVILEAWRDGARFDGWSEHFSFDRWITAAERALADEPVDVGWYTTREREQNEVLPGITSTPAWTATGSGRTGRRHWLAERSRTAAGPRASTAASATTSVPRSRWGRGMPCCCLCPRSRRGWRSDGRQALARPGLVPAVQSCASGTPSAARCASPRTATSSGPSSGRCAARGSRWPTRPGSPLTRRSPTRTPRPPERPVRLSMSRSAWSGAATPRPCALSSRGAAPGPGRHRGR